MRQNEPRRPRITLDAIGAVIDAPAAGPVTPETAKPPAPTVPAVLPALARAAEMAVEPLEEDPGSLPGEPAPLPESVGLPRFLTAEMPAPKRRKPWVGVAIGAAVLAVCGYLTRGLWWDETVGSLQAFLGRGKTPALGLRTLDSSGQLQIRWDPQSLALRKPHGARLIIADGTRLRAIPLDMAHLGSGIFTYGRLTEKVDVALVITEANGQTIREQTTFLGSPAPAPDAQIQAVKERDDLRDQNDQLQAELAKERDKGKKQDREIRYLRDQLERQLRLRRLEKQLTPDK